MAPLGQAAGVTTGMEGGLHGHANFGGEQQLRGRLRAGRNHVWTLNPNNSHAFSFHEQGRELHGIDCMAGDHMAKDHMAGITQLGFAWLGNICVCVVYLASPHAELLLLNLDLQLTVAEGTPLLLELLLANLKEPHLNMSQHSTEHRVSAV